MSVLAPSSWRWMFLLVIPAACACTGTDTGNPIESGSPGGNGTIGGGGTGTGSGGNGGNGGAAGGTRIDGGPPSGLRRRCDDGRVPAPTSDAACGGCAGGWFCCSALEATPFCAHESHPCFREQLCDRDADAGVEPDADGGAS